MKIGRNEPCPCGSGKKYKRCCLHKDEDQTKDQFSFTETEDEKRFLNSEELELISSSYDDQQKRFFSVLGVKGDGNVSTDRENIEKYFQYLVENISHSCILTGIEDFSWEERYVFGGRSQSEYKRLKKTMPSYTDSFKLLKLVNHGEQILAKVMRVTDKKIFDIPLDELEAKDRKSKDYQILDDYSVWYVNF
ncbi:YecA family protein [Magnetococcales bacterium HHB-1]